MKNGSTWPEQEFVDAWLARSNITVSHDAAMHLKHELTRPRLENDGLRKQIDNGESLVRELESRLSNATDHIQDLEGVRVDLMNALADMVAMNEQILQNIAEFSKDPRILNTPSPRLIKAKALLRPTP